MTDRVQCAFCLAYPRVKADGTMYAHGWGRQKMMKPCPGSGRTKAEAKAAKSEGPPYEVLSGGRTLIDGTREVRPEDIF